MKFTSLRLLLHALSIRAVPVAYCAFDKEGIYISSKPYERGACPAEDDILYTADPDEFIDEALGELGIIVCA